MPLVQYLSRSVLDGLYPACCSAASSSTADARSSAVVSFTQRNAAFDALTLFEVAAGAALDAAAAVVGPFLGDGIREAPDAGIASKSVPQSPSAQLGAPRAPKN